jgi:hypothetical protein
LLWTSDRNILQTGLYVYATTGQAPFDEALVRDAFMPKSK